MVQIKAIEKDDLLATGKEAVAQPVNEVSDIVDKATPKTLNPEPRTLNPEP